MAIATWATHQIGSRMSLATRALTPGTWRITWGDVNGDVESVARRVGGVNDDVGNVARDVRNVIDDAAYVARHVGNVIIDVGECGA